LANLRKDTGSDDLEIALTKYDCLLLGRLNASNQNDAEAIENVLHRDTYSISMATSSGNYEKCTVKITGVIDTHYEPKDDPESDMAKVVEEDKASYEINEGIFFAPFVCREQLDALALQSRTCMFLCPLTLLKRLKHLMLRNDGLLMEVVLPPSTVIPALVDLY